jgi:hypothetical protein
VVRVGLLCSHLSFFYTSCIQSERDYKTLECEHPWITTQLLDGCGIQRFQRAECKLGQAWGWCEPHVWANIVREAGFVCLLSRRMREEGQHLWFTRLQETEYWIWVIWISTAVAVIIPTVIVLRNVSTEFRHGWDGRIYHRPIGGLECGSCRYSSTKGKHGGAAASTLQPRCTARANEPACMHATWVSKSSSCRWLSRRRPIWCSCHVIVGMLKDLAQPLHENCVNWWTFFNSLYIIQFIFVVSYVRRLFTSPINISGPLPLPSYVRRWHIKPTNVRRQDTHDTIRLCCNRWI